MRIRTTTSGLEIGVMTLPTPRSDALGLDGVPSLLSFAVAGLPDDVSKETLDGLTGAAVVDEGGLALPFEESMRAPGVCRGESMEKSVKTSCVASALASATDEELVLRRLGIVGVSVVVGASFADPETGAGDEGGVPNNPNNLSVAGALVMRCGGSAAVGVSALVDVDVVVAVEAVGVETGVALFPFNGGLPGDDDGFKDKPAKRSSLMIVMSIHN